MSVPPPYLQPALAALRNRNPAMARRLAETLLLERPGEQVVEHLLAVACCQTGDLPAGIRHFEAVLARDPGNAEVRLMLGRALADTGANERLIELTDGQDVPQLVELRAAAANALGRHADEVAALERLVAWLPQDASLHRALGHARALDGQREPAVEALDQALLIDPGSTETRVELGQLLCDLGYPETGLTAFEDGFATAPDDEHLLLGQARALTMLRRFDEAELVYERLLALAPTKVDAIREYGLLLERTGRIDLVPRLIERVRAVGVPDDELGLLKALSAFRGKDYDEARSLAQASIAIDPVRVYRLISKIDEAAGDLAGAFAAAQAMNQAAVDHDYWRERGAHARREIRRLTAAIDDRWTARSPAGERDNRPAPAFIVGFPRSGTTLLDTFLMGHPDVDVLEEEPMLEAAKAVVGDLALLPDASHALIAAARDAYFKSLDERIAPQAGRLVVDKMPFNMLGATIIDRLFPEASIIFAQRHPCDVVLSGFMQSFRLNDGMASFLDLRDSADLYDAAMGLWTRSRDVLPLRIHDLVYEDLVEDPSAVLRPLIAFLGLEWRPELLDHQATAARRGTIITPSYDQVTQPINRRAKGRWRRLHDEMAPVLPVLLPWARRLGYED